MLVAAAPSPDDRPSVVYASYSLIPSGQANSIQVMKMCEAFAEQSADLELLCRRPNRAAGDPAAHYGVKRNFKIRSFFLPRVPLLSRALYTAVSLLRLRGKPKGFLLFGRDAYLMGVVAALGWPAARLALEVHQPPSGPLEHFLQSRVFGSRHFAGLVVISEALRRDYLERYPQLDVDQVWVAHDGADPLPLDEAAEPIDRSGSPFQLGYVGSLAPGKGLELISQLAPMLPDCEFHIVGGSAEDVAAWQAKAPHSNLIFHGVHPPETIPGWRARFDVLLAPYQDQVLVGAKRVDVAKWMSPLKVFEAMASAKPLLASDLPVLREVLVDGENALLAPADDPKYWAERVQQLRDDAGLRAKLGRAARAQFLAEYTWARRAELILSRLTGRPHVVA